MTSVLVGLAGIGFFSPLRPTITRIVIIKKLWGFFRRSSSQICCDGKSSKRFSFNISVFKGNILLEFTTQASRLSCPIYGIACLACYLLTFIPRPPFLPVPWSTALKQVCERSNKFLLCYEKSINRSFPFFGSECMPAAEEMESNLLTSGKPGQRTFVVNSVREVCALVLFMKNTSVCKF